MESFDGPISFRQGHGTADPGMSFASAVPLRVCCSSFSGIEHGISGRGESSTACNVVCLSLGNIPSYWTSLPVDCQEEDASLSYTV